MLGVREYNAAVDVWSVGCMMAEMIRGDTPFKGENEIDQLLKIFELLGRPCPQEWPEVQQGENFQTCFPRWPKPASLAHVCFPPCSSGSMYVNAPLLQTATKGLHIHSPCSSNIYTTISPLPHGMYVTPL